jgi:hypothetical protein
MNSYFKMNRDYREAWLAGKPDSVPAHFRETVYPANLTYRDFGMYLAHPTFTYQDHYPLMTKPGKTLFWRACLILLAMVRITLCDPAEWPL